MALSFSVGAGVRFHCGPMGQHILAYRPPTHTHTLTHTCLMQPPKVTHHKIYCIPEFKVLWDLFISLSIYCACKIT